MTNSTLKLDPAIYGPITHKASEVREAVDLNMSDYGYEPRNLQGATYRMVDGKWVMVEEERS